MEITTGNIIASLFGFGGFIINVVIGAFFIGKIDNKVDNNTKDIEGIGERNKKDLKETKISLQTEFHTLCKAKELVWNANESQNKQDHKHLASHVEALRKVWNEDKIERNKNDKEFKKEVFKRFDSVSECLKNIQLQKEC
jgi:hypothetical protein